MAVPYIFVAGTVIDPDQMNDNFTYVLSPDEVDKFKGKLRDQMVRLQVTGIMPGFNGELRVEGRLEVPTAKS